MSYNATSPVSSSSDTYVFIGLLVVFAVATAWNVLVDGLRDPNRNKFKLMLHTIIIITSVVPPELPMELSLAVTNSLKSLLAKRVYCTEVFRIPLAGRVDCCCFDKTGTITSDDMVFKGVVVPVSGRGGGGDAGGGDAGGDDTGGSRLSDLLQFPDGAISGTVARIMGCCHSLAVSNGSVIGDPLEKAVLEAVGWNVGCDDVCVPPYSGDTSGSGTSDGTSNATAASMQIIKRYPFSSALARMSVLCKPRGSNNDKSDKTDASGAVLYCKGSPEGIKKLCCASSLPDDYDLIKQFHMRKGRRVLAVASREFGGARGGDVARMSRDAVERDLVFEGFVVLDCPMKSDSVSVVKELVDSKHSCVMITGDAVLTAYEVSRKVGIVGEGGEMGLELRKMIDGGFGWYDMNGGGDRRKSIVIPFDIRDVRQVVMLKKKGHCLCIEGEVLESIVLSCNQINNNDNDGRATKGTMVNDSNNIKNIMLSQASLKILSTITPYISVFARHTPYHKEAVISSLNISGKYTLMCGDGTNDVGALKASHVGISLVSVPEIEKIKRNAGDDIKLLQKVEKCRKKVEKAKKSGDSAKIEEAEKLLKKAKKKAEVAGSTSSSITRMLREADEELSTVALGDASVASPFTYRGTSIDCCKQVILQGRCTLVIMLQIYKILGVNCLVTALVLSKLTMLGVKQGDWQLTSQGLIVAALFFLISLAKPLSTLSATRPPSSVLCAKALVSIASQFAVHYTAIMAAVAVSLPFLDPDDTSNTMDGPFNPTPLNSSTFLIQLCVIVNVFATNYVGHPFMQSLRENKLLFRGLLLAAFLLVVVVTEAFPPLNDLVQMGPMPDADALGLEGAVAMPEWGAVIATQTALGLKGCLLAIMAADTLGVAITERAVNALLYS
jgi:cation-transporting ATPase 13A1